MRSFTGTAGNDAFVGSDEADTFSFNAVGVDTAHGGAEADGFYVSTSSSTAANITLYGESGADYFTVSDSFGGLTTTLYAGDDRDHIVLNSGRNLLADAGAGDDFIEVTAAARPTLTLGDGHDVVVQKPSGGLAALTITDFQTSGASSDRIDLSNYLVFSSPSVETENPFATGLLRLTQSGADTLVQAFSGSYDLVILRNVTASALTAENLGGYDPLGGPTVGINVSRADATDPVDRGHGWGSAGDDVIIGGVGNDVLNGAGTGADRLEGGGGNDFLESGGIAATQLGGDGDDTLYYFRAAQDVASQTTLLDGGAGQDTITAVINNTATPGGVITVSGGDGDDTVTFYGAMEGSLLGGDGDDILIATGTGNDTLNGGLGNDTARFWGSASLLPGGVTVDLSMTGPQATGGGMDTLISIENLAGTGFNDSLTGNEGDNVLDGVGGDDTLNGAGGSDWASYAYTFASVNVDLALSGAQNTLGGGADTLISIENLEGTLFADILKGNDEANVFRGGRGDDTFDGRGGRDRVEYLGSWGDYAVDISLSVSGPQWAGEAYDTLLNIEDLTGGNLDDTLEGDAGFNVLDGAGGRDTVTYVRSTVGVTASLAAGATPEAGADALLNFENLTGSAHDDILTGDDGANVIFAGAGNDTLAGLGGDDTLWGEGGVDTATYAGAASAVTVSLAVTAAQNTGGDGTDTLSGIENLSGSGFNDTLTGDGGDNVLYGRDGNDWLDGGLGDDTLDGAYPLTGDNGTDTVSYASATGAVYADMSLATRHVTGAAGTDTLVDIEVIIGSAFADTLKGGAGGRHLMGGDGDDVLSSGGDGDRLDGGAGRDTATYAGATAGVTASLYYTLDVPYGQGSDIFVDVEDLTGSQFSDVLSAAAGGSLIQGLGGNDTIFGKEGVDNLVGGDGDDVLDGDEGDDLLDGGAGSDTAAYISATAGVNVTLSTAIGAPAGAIVPTTDTLLSIENITGSAFADALKGDGGANGLTGGGGRDILFGEGGDDTFVGGADEDNLFGGLGDDTLDGGAETDTANYSDLPGATGATAGVTVDLRIAGAQNTGGAGIDTLVSIESVIGSQLADVLIGDSANNVLMGVGGDDVIEGGLGQDVMDGGSGADTLTYASATSKVTVSLAVGTAQNTGGGGLDIISGFENLTGSAFDDVLSGDAGDNILRGEAGEDTLVGGAGDDTLIGGDGVRDTARYANATGGVTVNLSLTDRQDVGGGQGADLLSGIEGVIGSLFADTLTGDHQDNNLFGAAGDDVLEGGAGDDSLNGAEGNDTASYRSSTLAVDIDMEDSPHGSHNTVGAGVDSFFSIENMTGSGLDDVLRGDFADNVLDGWLGSDILFGRDGNDVLRDGGETTNRDFLYGGAGNDTYYVTSSLTGPTDLIYEGAAVAGAEAGANDVDVIYSNGEFFWDFYGVGEELHVETTAGSQLVGGTNTQSFFGNTGNDIMLAYGGSNRVDAGGGVDAIGLGLYGLDESFDGANTIVMKAGSGMDYVYDFESGVDKIDLSAFNFGITGAQILAQAINVDNAGTADDYCFFYLTSAGGVDNFIVFMGLLSSQLSASDFVTGTV